MIEHLSTITELPIEAIKVEHRLRNVSRKHVESLKASIRQSGFRGKIWVRRKKDGDYLVEGLHRLTAMQELGETVVPVDLFRCNDAEARMMEIDGNLASQPLIPVDLALFLAERKSAYERLHPEAKAATGAGLASKRWDTAEMISVASFAESVAENLGLSERHVRNFVRAGSLLRRKEIERLRAAPKRVEVMDLIDIGKMGEAEERGFVVEELSAGRAKTVKAAREAYRAARGEAPAPASPKDATLARLMDAWDRAGKGARMAFLEERGAEVAALFGEIDQGGAA